MPDDRLYRFPACLESLDAMAAHLQATVPACDAAARLRAEAYSLMIDLAEKELKVAIRKKSDTK